MIPKITTNPHYYQLAEQAGILECGGYLAKAEKQWIKAGHAARHPFNIQWCQNRAEFCSNQKKNRMAKKGKNIWQPSGKEPLNDI